MRQTDRPKRLQLTLYPPDAAFLERLDAYARHHRRDRNAQMLVYIEQGLAAEEPLPRKRGAKPEPEWAFDAMVNTYTHKPTIKRKD